MSLSVSDPAALTALLSQHSKLCLFFWAQWHEPSRQGGQMDSVAELLASMHPAVKFVKIEAEAVPDVSEKYEITVVPTFVCIQDGAVVRRLEGANAAALTTLIQSLSAGTIQAQAAPSQQPAAEDLNTKLHRLINSAPVMLFLKGNTSEPKCGFSRKMIDLLTSNDIKFTSFDILKDEEVRAGLKTYSNWPTFPQLYVQGKLIGGVDIVQEMANSGDLKGQLAAEGAIESEQITASSGVDQQEALNDRLRKLINRSEVMLFMKGSPDNVNCGFSRQTVELLRSEGIQFDSFDIFSDNAVREGIKVFSDWPTFPQLYVRGELIGGLDILKELQSQGPLADQLGIVPLEKRLHQLINRSPVMLFMKGEPETVHCGFSKAMVNILREEGIEFDSFDIFSDNAVREGLKKYSNWPTYPQLYIKGELVGGVDIVKEMRENGDFEALKNSLSTA